MLKLMNYIRHVLFHISEAPKRKPDTTTQKLRNTLGLILIDSTKSDKMQPVNFIAVILESLIIFFPLGDSPPVRILSLSGYNSLTIQT
jgi:hypothetical protein